jgi:hypothetical protein
VHNLVESQSYLVTKLVTFGAGPVAQWLEQGTHNPLVVGSSPTGPTIVLGFNITYFLSRELKTDKKVLKEICMLA